MSLLFCFTTMLLSFVKRLNCSLIKGFTMPFMHCKGRIINELQELKRGEAAPEVYERKS